VTGTKDGLAGSWLDHRLPKKIGQILRDADILKQADRGVRFKFDRDVDVARRFQIAPSGGPGSFSRQFLADRRLRSAPPVPSATMREKRV